MSLTISNISMHLKIIFCFIYIQFKIYQRYHIFFMIQFFFLKLNTHIHTTLGFRFFNTSLLPLDSFHVCYKLTCRKYDKMFVIKRKNYSMFGITLIFEKLIFLNKFLMRRSGLNNCLIPTAIKC